MPRLSKFTPKSFAEQEEELNQRVKEEVAANPMIAKEKARTEQPIQQTVAPSPTPSANQPNTAYVQPNAANTQPAAGVAPQAPQAEYQEPTKGKGGRKKSNRTIRRENGLTIFLEDAHNEALNNLRGSDKQEVIRVALDNFIKAYYRKGRFTTEAYDLIYDYIDRTTLK